MHCAAIASSTCHYPSIDSAYIASPWTMCGNVFNPNNVTSQQECMFAGQFAINPLVMLDTLFIPTCNITSATATATVGTGSANASTDHQSVLASFTSLPSTQATYSVSIDSTSTSTLIIYNCMLLNALFLL